MDESQPTASMSVSDGRMTIGGSPHRYLQDITRRFRLDASALRFVGGYASRDGRLDDAQRIEAQAKIVDGSLRRAGLEGAAQRLRLTLRPFAASGDSTRLLLMLSYRDENGEAEPFADGFLAPAVFEALKADMLSGLAQELSLDAEKTNPNGGAIALGHPVGATGAILTVKMMHELERIDGRFGLVSLCIGGGQGIATIFERVN